MITKLSTGIVTIITKRNGVNIVKAYTKHEWKLIGYDKRRNN